MVEESVETAAAEPAPPRRSGLRATLVGIAVGLLATVAGAGLAFSIVAIPIFGLASTEGEGGLGRDVIRTGLFKVAVPFGLITGLAVGIAVGVWYGRGGRLPTDRTPFYE